MLCFFEGDDLYRRTASLNVPLKTGWNQVNFRAYNVGYPPFKVGLLLKASEEELWPLRFSNEPPR